MRKGLVTVLSLVFLLPASVRGGVPQSPNTTGLCTISGTVINANTRQPIRKAQVQIQSARGGTLTQNTLRTGDGRFEFTNLPPGRYLLQAEATGYVLKMDEPSGTELTLAAGEQKREVLLPLLPEAVISGMVYDEDGDPVQSAMVWAFIPVYS
jgi:predicted phage tail protein